MYAKQMDLMDLIAQEAHKNKPLWQDLDTGIQTAVIDKLSDLIGRALQKEQGNPNERTSNE